MLKTVRDACIPHKMALDFSMAEQIEDLRAVIGQAGDGDAFFAKNHITAGMRQLFELGLRRLAGRSDQAVFELTQAMGGGKTHTMIAFGLVARDADDPRARRSRSRRRYPVRHRADRRIQRTSVSRPFPVGRDRSASSVSPRRSESTGRTGPRHPMSRRGSSSSAMSRR